MQAYPPDSFVYKNERELGKMGIIMVLSGIIGLALLVYLFYVLFRGENL
ncbi:potassium-transporting ATPase subunit F [Clostridium sp. Marseille-P2415]